jgi:hypothetical protein
MLPTSRSLIVLSALAALIFSACGDLKAQTRKSASYTAMCSDPVEGFKGHKCQTSTDGEGAMISCGLVLECGSNPVCVQPPTISYRCEPVTNATGETSWHCKGSIGTLMDSSTESTITDDDFNNKNTRCARICRSCRSGWK